MNFVGLRIPSRIYVVSYPVHPFVSTTMTEYEPLSLTTMLWVESPVDHKYAEYPAPASIDTMSQGLRSESLVAVISGFGGGYLSTLTVRERCTHLPSRI